MFAQTYRKSSLITLAYEMKEQPHKIQENLGLG